MIKFRFKTLVVIFSVSLMALVTTSCGSTTNATTAVEASVEPAIDSEEEMSYWDKFYALPEKEQVYMAKNDDPETYSKLDYASWDEYEVLKFMSFACKDVPSSYDPYGLISNFIDTSKLTKLKSALISFYCVPSAGSSGVINIFVVKDKDNIIYTTHKLTTIYNFFGYENIELKDNQVDFVFSGYSSSDLGLCCRDTKDTGKIYFKNGIPIMEFTSFNDYRIKIYNLNYGPVFDSDRFEILTWGDSTVYGQDEIYNQAEKYNLKTGEVSVDKEAVIKKACEDFSYSIPKTDLANRGLFVPLTEVRKMVSNWKQAARLETELSLPLEYMKTYIDIASTEIISDDTWLEGLRQYGMIPRSEVEKLEEPLKILGSKINKQGNKVCAKYELGFGAPNETKK